MNKFDAMDDQELRRYVLDHRHDEEAFQAHLIRVRSRGDMLTIYPEDPNSQEKLARHVFKKARFTSEQFRSIEIQMKKNLPNLRLRYLDGKIEVVE